MTTSGDLRKRPNCPACRDGVIVRGILVFKRVYLCDSHRVTHDAEAAKENAREARRAEAIQ
jgi:hypothetical protein